MIRLHAADIMFYAQSALESVQLLLRSGLSARRGEPMGARHHRPGLAGRACSTWRWACWPGPAPRHPIYFSGYDPGYESKPFPGLYDPLTAGEVSPLLSAFEAVHVQQVAGRATDAFPVLFAPGLPPDAPLLALQDACASGDVAAVRAELDALSWWLLDAMLQQVPRKALTRVAALTAPFEDGLSPALPADPRGRPAIRQEQTEGRDQLP